MKLITAHASMMAKFDDMFSVWEASGLEGDKLWQSLVSEFSTVEFQLFVDTMSHRAKGKLELNSSTCCSELHCA